MKDNGRTSTPEYINKNFNSAWLVSTLTSSSLLSLTNTNANTQPLQHAVASLIASLSQPPAKNAKGILRQRTHSHIFLSASNRDHLAHGTSPDQTYDFIKVNFYRSKFSNLYYSQKTNFVAHCLMPPSMSLNLFCPLFNPFCTLYCPAFKQYKFRTIFVARCPLYCLWGVYTHFLLVVTVFDTLELCGREQRLCKLLGL